LLSLLLFAALVGEPVGDRVGADDGARVGCDEGAFVALFDAFLLFELLPDFDEELFDALLPFEVLLEGAVDG